MEEKPTTDSQPQSDNPQSNQPENKRQFYKRNSRYYRRYSRFRKKETEGTEESPSRSESFHFKKLSIVVPLLNEEESLRPLHAEIKKSLRKITIDYEIILIDDGSTDNSLKVIKELIKNDRKIRFVSFRKNYGKSAALQTGFKIATGDVVLTMDADLQDDPNEIADLLRKLEEGYDLVSGWKKKRFDPFLKKYTSRFFNAVTRLLTGINLHDFNCGLKVYRQAVVKNIKVYGELHRYVPVLAKWKGFSIAEIPVKHHPRRYGKTKFGMSRFYKGYVDLITVLFTTRYIRRPMHLFGFFGLIAFLAGFIVNGILTYEWIVGIPLKNRPLLFLGILLIIVGIQFFSVGLLGEMLVHNFQDEAEYSIKEQG